MGATDRAWVHDVEASRTAVLIALANLLEGQEALRRAEACLAIYRHLLGGAPPG